MSAPPPPRGVAEAFRDEPSGLLRYVERLCTVAVPQGFLGPHEVDRIWCRHIVNSAAVGELIRTGSSVIDLGSGAGLPGVVLALVRPDLRLLLLEGNQRRADFLEATVDELGLRGRAEVCRNRAENVVGQLRADVVVARAVAPLPRVAGWAAPLLLPRGELLVLRGAGATTDVQTTAPLWQRVGFVGVSVVECGRLGECPPTRIVRATAGPTPGRAGGAGRSGRQPAARRGMRQPRSRS